MRGRQLKFIATAHCILVSMGLAGVDVAAQDMYAGVGFMKDPLGAYSMEPFVKESSQKPEDCGVNAESHGEVLRTTLTEALHLAACNNTELSIAREKVIEQMAALGEAKAAFLPTLNVGVGVASDITTYPGGGAGTSAISSNNGSVTANWRILDFGNGRSATERSAIAQINAAIAASNDKFTKTMGSVAEAYLTAYFAIDASIISAEKAEITEQLLQSAIRKEAQGVGTRTETIRAQLDVSRANIEVSRADADRRSSLFTLRYQLGEKRDIAPTAISLPIGEEEKGLDEWLELALKSNNSIVAANMQYVSARARLDARKADYYPALDMGVSYFENGRPGQGLSSIRTNETLATITLNVPVFSGFSTTYQTKGLVSQVRQASMQIDDTKNAVVSEVSKAYMAESGARRVLSFTKANLERTQENLLSVQHRNELGDADANEVSQARLELLGVKVDFANANKACLINKVRLLVSVGILNVNLNGMKI